ncbi:uncharacterized protein N0V89_004395 [Didymosphaeria variabile]|uniref:Uncharacterized protein n=1 Tax=Didymosphaeria variabile TaxID=1932322 RepID=A0A9W9CD71_9PLEO|nr:uncharacterized protein N0V89_004395 [Didymosphaeria variabile]KAJ4356363.1 hypothetical protein N0V89_004395 [Didymosphaeria variabile]
MQIPPLLSLLPLAVSSPSSDNDTQTWTITRLDYHYMTEYPGFGPPHMPWPVSAIFNTTLSFDVSIPDATAPHGSWIATCELGWEHASLPGTFVACREQKGEAEDEGKGTGMVSVYFGVEKWNGTIVEALGEKQVDMPFSLKMWRFDLASNVNKP